VPDAGTTPDLHEAPSADLHFMKIIRESGSANVRDDPMPIAFAARSCAAARNIKSVARVLYRVASRARARPRAHQREIRILIITQHSYDIIMNYYLYKFYVAI
jgi:hypothetical protein